MKKKPDNWPKVNKDLGELPYINDLTVPLQQSSSLGRMPTFFLSRCVSLPCFYLKWTVSLRALQLVVVVCILYLFLQFCLCEKCFFHWGQEPGGVVARIPCFHPGYPGSIPGQGFNISLHATTHCCLYDQLVKHLLFEFPPCVSPVPDPRGDQQ